MTAREVERGIDQNLEIAMAEAAREIKTLISTATWQVDTGVNLLGETGNALAGILSNGGEVSSVVSEIAAAADEQATGLSEVNAVNAMDQMTQRNARMVEESNSACQSLGAETEELVSLTGHCHLVSQPTFHGVACE